MPAMQTTYPATIAPGVLGMIANGEWVTNIISRVVDPTAPAAINFGDPVLQGPSEQTVVPVGTGSGAFRGIAIRDASLTPTDNDQYPATATIGVMTKGVVWVNAAAAVSPGQGAYFTPAGSLTGASSGNAAIPGAIWESSAAAPGLAKLRLG